MKLVLFFVISLNFYGSEDYFSFTHQNCFLRFDDQSDYKEQIKGLLKTRGFRLKKYLPKSRVHEKDMYFLSTIALSDKKLYKDCTAIVQIKVSKKQRPNKSDKVVAKGEVKRSLPRVTFKGKERCTRAIRDAFVHIPTCKVQRTKLQD